MYPYLDDELISSLHKCMRSSDIARASYFAKIIKEKTGVWRVKQYLFFIVLEETLSINLYNEGLKLFLKDDELITDKDIYSFIYKFANTKKKWDYKQGHDLYIKHLLNDINFKHKIINNKDVFNLYNQSFDEDKLIKYENLVKQSDISYNKKTKTHKKTYLYSYPEMLYLLDFHYHNKNINSLIQLSFLFYLNKDALDFNLLSPIFKNNKLYKSMMKLDGKYAYLFNYVALFYSLLNPLEDYYIDFVDNQYIETLEYRINKAIKEKRFIKSPLYALDNHTRIGKEKFLFLNIEYNKKLNKNVDLRYSGMWYGILWRIESNIQFNTIADKWEDVKMNNVYEFLWKKQELYSESFKKVQKNKNKYVGIKNINKNIIKYSNLEELNGNILNFLNTNLKYNEMNNYIFNNYPSVKKDIDFYKNALDYNTFINNTLNTSINEKTNIISAFIISQLNNKNIFNYEKFKNLLTNLKEDEMHIFIYNNLDDLDNFNKISFLKIIDNHCNNYKIIQIL